LAKPYRNALLLFKASDKHFTLFFPALESFSGVLPKKLFLNDSGLLNLVPCGFRVCWPRLRVVGSCIRSVVVILPVGSITSVGIRNFNIPGYPGSPDWPSALRLSAFSCFGLLNFTVSGIVFPAVCRASAIVGILHSIVLRLLFVTSLHNEYHRDLIAARVITFLLGKPCGLFFISSKNHECFVANSLFESFP
jgi:hypothetical protein